jgi:glycosyltransferase involved in cell wall biosynthesis
MAAGVPVVASTRASLPELIGNAGLLADPSDADAFTAAVMTAATDESTRKRLRDEGRVLASRYTWDRAARGVHGHLSRLAH